MPKIKSTGLHHVSFIHVKNFDLDLDLKCTYIVKGLEAFYCSNNVLVVEP